MIWDIYIYLLWYYIWILLIYYIYICIFIRWMFESIIGMIMGLWARFFPGGWRWVWDYFGNVIGMSWESHGMERNLGFLFIDDDMIYSNWLVGMCFIMFSIGFTMVNDTCFSDGDESLWFHDGASGAPWFMTWVFYSHENYRCESLSITNKNHQGDIGVKLTHQRNAIEPGQHRGTTVSFWWTGQRVLGGIQGGAPVCQRSVGEFITPMSPVGLWLIYLYYIYIYIWFINQDTSLWLIDRTSFLRDYKPTFTSCERGHHLVGSYQRTETHEKNGLKKPQRLTRCRDFLRL